MLKMSIRLAGCRREILQITILLISLIILAVFSAVSSADTCGGVIQAENGTITSPSFPNPYSPNQRCVWEIPARPSAQIVLTFTRIDLEANADWVAVRSINHGDVFEHGKYTGSVLPLPIFSRSDELSIEFRSDASIQKSGFAADFSTVTEEHYKNHSINLLLKSRDPLFYEYDFDPVHLEKKLIQKALSNSRLPQQFQEDLKLLIGSYSRTLVRKSQLTNLETRYEIVLALPDADPSEVGPRPFPDIITPLRLILMFPEYFRFDLAVLDVRHFSPQCQKLNGILPKIMKYPEFAGLIPTADGALKETERNALIVAYLYWQFCNVAEAERSDEYLEKLGSIAMKRIELSRLPNELRIKALEAKRIIEDGGRFFGTDLELSKHVPSQIHYVAADFPNFTKI